MTFSNQYRPITIVAATSSKPFDPRLPRAVVIEQAESHLPQRSAVVLNQILPVDHRRLGRNDGELLIQSMKRVEAP
jgi:mRNA-degrading endonuclease toxin of MazEF toxin-antitoxin module